MLPSLTPLLLKSSLLLITLPSYVTYTSLLLQHAQFGMRFAMSPTLSLSDVSSENAFNLSTVTKICTTTGQSFLPSSCIPCAVFPVLLLLTSTPSALPSPNRFSFTLSFLPPLFLSAEKRGGQQPLHPNTTHQCCVKQASSKEPPVRWSVHLRTTPTDDCSLRRTGG